jgi:hypothetical protein
VFCNLRKKRAKGVLTNLQERKLKKYKRDQKVKKQQKMSKKRQKVHKNAQTRCFCASYHNDLSLFSKNSKK